MNATIDPFAEVPDHKPQIARKGRKGETIKMGKQNENLTAADVETVKAATPFVDAVFSPPRLKAFAPAGEFTPMAQLNGVELLVVGIEDITTKFGQALLIRCNEVNESGEITHEHKVVTSATVLMPALIAVREQVNAGDISYPLAVRFVLAGPEAQPYWTIE